ncbi:helix-turn-helix domain-containing protein (plasmid) [Halobaculum sp. CBA1158]|uniref:helix-turn-helix domain-containing protein n=1 Tax=Halobaculum sp. CBA1158 TaxID=2904243 RepID=UPI001F1630DE|nr:helix-turn-helix domain-containing protein [Halobaculum sp. CBA1158]UIP01649.1 helix-turn-helix domain-containing protein [Halobaculum sp. CBA1158]
MVDSMSEMLRRDLECESLLDCFHGLNDLDRRVFRLLVKADEPLTVDELADAIDRERTTAYRSLQRLQEAGIVEADKRSFESGSYYHVFSPADPHEVADEMQRLLNDWYAMMGQLIAEFREKYDEFETHNERTPPPDPK